MASEWEELEKLTKDELIIELVKARYTIRNMCSILEEISDTAGSHFLYDEGDEPSEEWMEKIVTYVKTKTGPTGKLDSSELEHYGVNGDLADEYCYGSGYTIRTGSDLNEDGPRSPMFGNWREAKERQASGKNSRS